MPKVSIGSKVYDLEVGEILFDGLDRQGETLAHGCLSGSCGACRIEVTEGESQLEPAGFIEKNTIEAIVVDYNKKFGEEKLKGKIVRLSCRAKVKGDIKINPLD